MEKNEARLDGQVTSSCTSVCLGRLKSDFGFGVELWESQILRDDFLLKELRALCTQYIWCTIQKLI